MLLVAAMAVPVSGQTLQGVVYDAFSQPFPFVSVYLKSNPKVGTSTGSDGTFVLNAEDGTFRANDVLIFSFIGYKTVEQPVKGMKEGENLSVKLVEQPILLEGAAVTAKVSRKANKEAKMAFLEKFKTQLYKDFPDRDMKYQVVSSLHVTREKAVLMSSEMIGDIQELPKKGRRGWDSLYIAKKSAKEYIDSRIKEGLHEMAEKSRADTVFTSKRAERKAKNSLGASLASLDDSQKEIDKRSMELHEMLWGGYITTGFKELEGDYKNWTITYTNDNTVLTYREKKGFLGIIRFERMLHFILDSDTYSVEKLSESLTAEVNIPIGYKLKGDELQLLNVVNLGGDRMEKFRLRHANADIKRNVIYKENGGVKSVDEKNMDALFSIEDNKKRKLDYQARALAKVTSAGVVNKGTK